jgi:group I intron endonuclease
MKQESCKIYYCYKATNKDNGKVYIGFAADPKTRWRNHKRDAETGRGYVFHQAIRKHGWENFEFEVICCGKDKLAMLEYVEPALIEQYHSNIGQNGYNMHRKVMGASSRVPDVRKKRGPLTDEQKAKLSIALKGHGGYTDESRRRISEAAKRQPKRYGKDNPFFGKHLSTESCQKIANARRGTKASPETRAKMANRVCSQETRLKLSESSRKIKHGCGQNNPLFGIQRSEETKKKIRETKRNHPYRHTEEAKRKMRQPTPSKGLSFWWQITNQNGETIKVKNLCAFCREHSIKSHRFAEGKVCKGYLAVKCVDYDCVVKFEGYYYDPLYGMVTLDKEESAAPRTAYQMGVDCWKTRKEACDALLKDCEKDLVKAKRRMKNAIVNTAVV